MASLVDDRICHVYRNRDEGMAYPTTDTPVKYTEVIDDEGTLEEVDICGLPMVQFSDTAWWFCVECDRPREEWPVRLPTA